MSLEGAVSWNINDRTDQKECINRSSGMEQITIPKTKQKLPLAIYVIL